jgi:hypothetical protein
VDYVEAVDLADEAAGAAVGWHHEGGTGQEGAVVPGGEQGPAVAELGVHLGLRHQDAVAVGPFGQDGRDGTASAVV